MTEYKEKTDKTHQIKLESSIEQVLWTSTAAALKGKVGIEVFTQFVGNNSEISIKISDKSGKTFETIKAKMSGNHFWKQITIPEKAKEELYAEVKLPKHSLSKKSSGLYLFPIVEIKNAKWDKQEARRGDILKLTADIKGLADGNEAEIQIWEHDADEAHELITKFPVIIKNKKIEAEWEFEYQGDINKDIPTIDECEEEYQVPQFFFRVIIGTSYADSELLQFKGWVGIELLDADGNPVLNERYRVKIKDGSSIEGVLNEQGQAAIIGIESGKCLVSFPDLESDEWEKI